MLKSGLKIVPLKVKESIILYKDTVVKGWCGVFLMEGHLTLIRCVYDTGLGAKNSQGFGMFEVI